MDKYIKVEVKAFMIDSDEGNNTKTRLCLYSENGHRAWYAWTTDGWKTVDPAEDEALDEAFLTERT